LEALATDRIGCGLAAVDKVLRSIAPQTLMNGHSELKLDAQLSLLPSAGREMSTSQSAVMLCGWGVKAGMVHSTCG